MPIIAGVGVATTTTTERAQQIADAMTTALREAYAAGLSDPDTLRARLRRARHDEMLRRGLSSES